MNAKLFLLALGTFAASTEAFMIAGILQPIARDLNVSIFSAGQFVTVFSLTYAIGSPILATLTGNWERRRLLAVAMLIFAIGNLICGLADSYTGFMVGRVIASIGAAIFVPTASTTASVLAKPEQRGRALAIVIGGQTIALATGVPLGAWMAQAFHWQTAFWLVTLLALIAALLIRLRFPVLAPQEVPSLRKRVAVAAQPNIGNALLMTLLWACGAFTFYTYVSNTFINLGAAESTITLVLLIWGITSFFGSSLGGYASDKIGTHRTLSLVLTCSALLLIGLSVLAGSSPFSGAVTVGMILMAVYGCCLWAYIPTQQSRLVTLGGKSAGVVISLNASAIYLGSAGGAYIGGLIVNHGLVETLGYFGGGGMLLTLLVYTLGHLNRRDASKVASD
ncbi:MFS transporter [Paenibacillus sp. CGMCC 1.16610]|uniref:MFS transporter n=1 Tax=Paenibacillus anseongense TaxID=2682845 RepID=A0ABW9UI08_9BACL|nr:MULTISPECIES: MFS transporter [Paenibacillus]MBA2939853.1 MFS transporter [Paenibacillus sp. CGMCC 1.16610]MVQ39513.1 MFS transporter [Paenibacillus anseongense]